MYPLTNGIYQEMFTALFPLVRESVIPIGVSPRGQVKQHGTGTLFAVGDKHFVVSASHVFGPAVAVGSPLYGFDLRSRIESGVQMHPIMLDGRIYRFDDHAPPDVGILRLTDDSAAQFEGRRFLRLDHAHVGPLPPQSGIGWVCGYPCSSVDESREDVSVFNIFTLAAPMSRPERDDLIDYDPQVHFLLDYRRETLCRVDGGDIVLPTSLEGISGCSVWQTWWPGEETPDTWRTRRVRAVGVQTSAYPRPQLIRATAWGTVLLLIVQAEPTLRPIIEFHFPELRL